MDNNKDRIQGTDNKSTVEAMFDSIAWRYDFLNHFLSFGIDRCWRKKAIRIISRTHMNPERILDVATGTGDLAIAAMKLSPGKITGIDISRKMIEAGSEKIRRRGFTDKIDLIECDSQNITFLDKTFDVALVAFGVRNFSDPLKGLSEMNRVIRPGGLIMVLEFSKPSGFFFRQLYLFYFLRIVPLIGKIFSKDSTAYRYLPESVMQFIDDEQFIDVMKQAGFTSITQKKLTGGIATIYTGLKS